MPLPTIIIRHVRENLKKCSLQPLVGSADISFFTYPACLNVNASGRQKLPSMSGYVLLDLDGPPLSREDEASGLILVDATWRLAEKIVRCLPELQDVPRRRLPDGFQTAYPRRQDDCPDASAGLASVEALYIAYRLMGKNGDALLDEYYWKDLFLQKNKPFFTSSL